MSIKQSSPDHYELLYAAGMTSDLVADGAFHKSSLNEKEEVSFQKTADGDWLEKTRSLVSGDNSHGTQHFHIAPNGRTLQWSFNGLSPTGVQRKAQSTWERTGPGKGIEGSWILTRTSEQGQPYILVILKDGNNAMTWASNSSKTQTLYRSLDGKPYADVGPTASIHDTSGITLVDEHTLKYDSYRDGKLLSTGKWTVSADGQALTCDEAPVSGKPYSLTYLRNK